MDEGAVAIDYHSDKLDVDDYYDTNLLKWRLSYFDRIC